jgi:hypothetical protein
MYKFLIIIFACSAALSQTLFVSPHGSDSNPGTKEKPFATIGRAKSFVRNELQEKAGFITVYLRGGTYRLKQTLVFSAEDSAADGFSISYKSYADERPVISSGVEVSGWQKCDEEPSHLPQAAKGRLWIADFPKGIDTFKTMFDDKGRLPRAIGKEYKPALPRTDPRVSDRKTLYFPAGSMRDFENLADVEVWIVPTFQWCHNILPLESVNVKDGFAKTAVTGTYPLAQREKGYDPSRFRVCNAADVLDEPGEWFMDSKQREIWLWPRDGKKPENVVIPSLNEIIRVEGEPGKPVSGLIFDGIIFRHAKRDSITDLDSGLQHDWEYWNKPNSMIRFVNSKDCTLRNCLLTESGGGGVRLDLYSQNNRIENCEISRLGGTGVAFIGDKVGRDFVNRGNHLINNNIHRIGLEFHHSAAVFLWQSGENRIANNRIHHTPYNGFSVGGVVNPHLSRQWRENNVRELTRVIDYSRLGLKEMQTQYDTDITWPMLLPHLYSRDNIFENNEIYRNVEILGDGNPFYIRMSGYGNIIRRNYFHSNYGSHSAGAMRFDGQQAGCVFEENVIYQCTGCGVNFHKANRIVNNIIVDIRENAQLKLVKPAQTGADIESDAGHFIRCVYGSGWTKVGVLNYDKAQIRNNVMVQLSEGFSEFYGDTVHWKGRTEKWTDFTLVKDTDNNLMWTPRNPQELKDWLMTIQKSGLDKNSVVADPLFVDLEDQDFRFRAESKALKMGIKPLDISNSGLSSEYPLWLCERIQDDRDKPLEIEALR